MVGQIKLKLVILFYNIQYYIGHFRSALMSKIKGMLSVHLMDCMIWMNKELSEKIAEL